MKASPGRRLPCEAIQGWCAVWIVLAIVCSIAGALPLVGQETPLPPRPRPPALTPTQVPATRTAEPIGVPSIIGMSAENAQLILRRYHLEGKPNGSERTAQYKPGIVSSQDPIAGASLPPDRSVKYWLAAPSLRPQSVTAPRIPVPSVVGWDLKRASEEILKAGLVLQVVDKKRSGKIVRQEPQAGTLVDPRTKVLLSVSAGPRPPPPPSPWLWLAIILGALAVTRIIYMRMRQKRITSNTPKFEVVLFKDCGEQQIASPGPLAFALELCRVVDSGDQKLEKVGPLVAAGGG